MSKPLGSKSFGGLGLPKMIAVFLMLVGFVIGMFFIVPGLPGELSIQNSGIAIQNEISDLAESDPLAESQLDSLKADYSLLMDDLKTYRLGELIGVETGVELITNDQGTTFERPVEREIRTGGVLGTRSVGTVIILACLGLGSLLIAIINRSQLFIPLLAANILVFFNVARDLSFFSIETTVNHFGNIVLSGNFYNIIQRSTEAMLLAMGMTLVISASKGADISVGAGAAISGAVFIAVLRLFAWTLPGFLLAFLACVIIGITIGTFNGTLVAVFRIQPMIATLIMFTTGRAIAYWINGGATPMVYGNDWLGYFGSFIPGVPIHTPIITAAVCGLILFLALKFTNLGLYTQSVGINENSARLVGINPKKVKLMAFMILGVCVAIAAVTSIARISIMNHMTIQVGAEMDAILAVAIGGNALSGGKFNVVGSVIGAYVITGLTETLYTMHVPSEAIQTYKAVVIIILVVMGSPVVKEKTGQLLNAIKARYDLSAVKEGA